VRPRTRSLAVVALVAVSACSGSGGSSATSRQARVEARGAAVMPFDQKRTTHVFHSTSTGGVQRVVANSPQATRQIELIRDHLRKETRRFGAGDFSDPMAIHGMKMPGITALRRGFRQVRVRYSTIARGAQIAYSASDSRLISALHAWFDAQLMDHGSHAHG